MITRERAAIKIVTVNRIARTLEYWIDLNTDTFVSVLRDDILKLEELAKDIYNYILDNPRESLFQMIEKIPNTTNLSKYLNNREMQLPKDMLKAFNQYMKSLNLIFEYVNISQQYIHGEDYILPEELKSEKAQDMFELAVANGLLTNNYKADPCMKPFQARLLAYAFIQKLSLKRGAWSTLARLWYDRDVRISNAYIPSTMSNGVQQIVKLFPEVDFSPCWNDSRNLIFNCNYSVESKRVLYNSLRDNGFIAINTTFKQFVAIFGDSKLEKKVNWIAMQLELVYFINLAFRNTHDLLNFRICNCFNLRGKLPNKNSMTSNFSCIVSTGRIKTFNTQLFEIAKAFSKSNIFGE